jgi:hypothetical protein
MRGGLATTGERAGSRNSEASVVGDIRLSLMIQSVRALLSAAHQWLNQRKEPYSTGALMKWTRPCTEWL